MTYWSLFSDSVQYSTCMQRARGSAHQSRYSLVRTRTDARRHAATGGRPAYLHTCIPNILPLVSLSADDSRPRSVTRG
ncbi:hypothetical protein I7I53_11753 [Histoplasma capsulatum var. duboisii H88]|uniref:Uncharacterized protein n=1 Tax=Ajellomyces capsulatus (strain H88) TaxID=544711 RepID=A0A8A1LYB8_AJEC8|nr:hypothetical protein I7I53_11753 [Histoplasma capsulatum var. duboisii H88]